MTAVDRSEFGMRLRIKDLKEGFAKYCKDWRGDPKKNPVEYWGRLITAVLEKCHSGPDRNDTTEAYMDEVVRFLDNHGIQTVLHVGMPCMPQTLVLGTRDDYDCELTPREHTQIGLFSLETPDIAACCGIDAAMVEEIANYPSGIVRIAKEFRSVYFPPEMEMIQDATLFAFLMLIPRAWIVDYCHEAPVDGLSCNFSMRLEIEPGVTALLQIDMGGRMMFMRKCWDLVENGLPPPFPKEKAPAACIGRGLTSPVITHSEELEGSMEYMAMHEDMVESRVIHKGFFDGQGPMLAEGDVDIELYLEKTLPKCECGLLDGRQYENDVCSTCGTACTVRYRQTDKIVTSTLSGEHTPYCDCHALQGKSNYGAICPECDSPCRVYAPGRVHAPSPGNREWDAFDFVVTAAEVIYPQCDCGRLLGVIYVDQICDECNSKCIDLGGGKRTIL